MCQQYLMIGTSSRFQEGEATIKFTSDIECEVLSLENGYVLFHPSRLPCYVFSNCMLTYTNTNKNPNVNKLSWAIYYWPLDSLHFCTFATIGNVSLNIKLLSRLFCVTIVFLHLFAAFLSKNQSAGETAEFLIFINT